MDKKRGVRIQERVKCEKCGDESAVLIKMLNTKEQKREDSKLVHLEDVVILIFKCQKCEAKFSKIIR